MTVPVLLDRFRPVDVPVEDLVLREGASLPGGSELVSMTVLRGLVKGTSEPILARPIGSKVEVIAGDTQVVAAKKRGEERIRVYVGEIGDEDALLLRLREGARRGDLNVVEEAEIMRELVSEFGLTQRELAMKCDRKQCTVANKLRLLRLPGEVLEALRAGEIGERHARALLRLEDADKQIEVFRKCVKMKLTAAEMESMCGRGAIRRVGRGRRGNGRVVFKDARIFQNALRKVVAEMNKAGLDVVCEEESCEGTWEFRVFVRM